MIVQLASEYGQHCNTMCDIVHTVLDPAHIVAELLFNLVFDGLILFLLWGKIVRPRLFRQIHKEIDTEHGVDHDRPSVNRRPEMKFDLDSTLWTIEDRLRSIPSNKEK